MELCLMSNGEKKKKENKKTTTLQERFFYRNLVVCFLCETLQY